MTLETARRIDAATAERTKAEIADAVADLTTAMGKKAEEYSLWNDAVDHLVVAFDRDWAYANVGPYAERLWGLDRSYAWNGGDGLIYASKDGALREDMEVAAQEVVDLHEVLVAARTAGKPTGGIVHVGQTPFVFGARVIEYEKGHAQLPPDPAKPVQIFLTRLDLELAKLAASRRIADLRIVPADGPVPPAVSSLPLRSIAGTSFGVLAWAPEQPGRTLLRETAPYAGGFMLALVALLFLFQRVLQRLKRQEPLRLSEARLAQAQRVAKLAYTVHLPEDRLEVSANFRELIGLHNEQVSAASEPLTVGLYLDRVIPDQRLEIQDTYRRAWEENTRFDVEYRIARPGGGHLDLQEVGEPFHDADGLVLGLITAIQDITARRRAEETIRHQANYDALTGLPNRPLFYDRLRQALRRAARDRTPVALLFIDLNRFKWVNDTLGHQTGDVLLREAAQRMAACVRGSETIARIGGDEFTVILSDVGDTGEVEKVARRLLDSLGAPFHIAGQTLHISASIGVTFAPDQGTDPELLVKNADVAMYHAKRQGTANWVFYDPGMDADELAHLRMENDLHEALAKGQLALFLQPVVEVGSGLLAGAQAEVRWNHPERGQLAPADFLHLAEANGLMLQIGSWLLDAACRQLADWRGRGAEGLRLTVPVSILQLKHPGFDEEVAGCLGRHGASPDRLILELPEAAMLAPSAEMTRTMQTLRLLGVAFSVGGFGTGYASLGHLRRLPVEFLKIDQAILRDVVRTPANHDMVHAIVALARSMNLTVIAEGVETGEQRMLAGEVRCGFVQGGLLGPPVPAGAFDLAVRPVAQVSREAIGEDGQD
ncbi:EAL domain-containing protein [Azospirillum sp. TSH100]|uniref:bifunctional diguanylate cyclase/phosphodiesterase n=1 Tax=Azospirillum sp. TSH100 TaxID=652764 RepID=UPI0013048FF1|nr:EAL domain-containing protein [Azospirillum sp. TSH100]